VLPAEHPWSRFLAFETPEDGLSDYVLFLATRERYRAAWHLIMAGDADGAARALGHAGYYTAPIDTYAHGVASIATSLLPLCIAITEGVSTELNEDEMANVAAAVANTVAADLMWNHDRHHEELAA
jgi:hypothetical protein